MCNTCDEKLNRKLKKRNGSNNKKQKCLENNEKTKKLPKCPSPRRSPVKKKKCLTKIEKIMLRIQPSIADRERYLHPEHINCFLEESERVYVEKPKCKPCPPKRQKICGKDEKNKENKESASGNVEGQNNKKGGIENKKEKDGDSDAIKENTEKDKNIDGKEESLEQKEARGQDKKNRKKRDKRKPKRKENIEEDGDSEISICSNDSEVCLVGLALTKEEKEEIEINRRKVHPPPDNGENSTESSKNDQELSMQEDKDNQSSELQEKK